MLNCVVVPIYDININMQNLFLKVKFSYRTNGVYRLNAILQEHLHVGKFRRTNILDYVVITLMYCTESCHSLGTSLLVDYLTFFYNAV